MTYAAVDGSRFSLNVEDGGYFRAQPRGVDISPIHTLVVADVADQTLIPGIFSHHDPDMVVHFAAETHVDRSIDSSGDFARTNLLGTHNLLEAVLHHRKGTRFLYVSTDEVYGPYTEDGNGFTEEAKLNPRNPYAATKAGAEHLVMAYHHTYGLDTIITRGCNTYGPYQHPEKLIPLFIMNAIEGKELPLYGDGLQEREWIYVEDHVDALKFLLFSGESGEIYNIGSGYRYNNLKIAEAICELTGRGTSLIKRVIDRPGHDRCYAIDSSKLLKRFRFRAERSLLTPDMDTQYCGLASVHHWYLRHGGLRWCNDQLCRKRLGTRGTLEDAR